MTIYTCNVGASGSSPAHQPCVSTMRVRHRVSQCVYFGRASTRPYSYAMYFICMLYVYVHVDIACVFYVLTIVENYVDL